MIARRRLLSSVCLTLSLFAACGEDGGRRGGRGGGGGGGGGGHPHGGKLTATPGQELAPLGGHTASTSYRLDLRLDTTVGSAPVAGPSFRFVPQNPTTR